MKQEDKELLLKDLSARLPYEVYAETVNELGETHINRISPENINLVFSGWFKECKPYLRPMSSMTEEEKKELDAILVFNGATLTCITGTTQTFDWLNKKMFDYRGLIEKGLALEAPEGMYN
jgi:hypothetical protein